MIATARTASTLDTIDPTLTAIHRLRYNVYCVEQGFVAMDDCPAAMETDEYDAHATHFAGEDSHGRVVATVRLVPHSYLGFPLERHAGRLFPEFRRIPHAQTAEISRLIIHKSHRRDTLRDPSLLVGLFREVCEESAQTGLRGFIAAMERGLWRLLQHLGMLWTPVGDPMDYYGEVIPYWSSLDTLRRVCEQLAAKMACTDSSFNYVRVPAALEYI